MEIKLRGVRGSIAVSDPDMARGGGNTACVEVRSGGGALVFLDAGTGLREAGKELAGKETGEAHIFLSHGHADHIVGLWFFEPLHRPGWKTFLYLPEWLGRLPDYFYRCGFFPVPFEELKGAVEIRMIREGDSIVLGKGSGKTEIDAFSLKHPGGNLAYLLKADGGVFLYTGDAEITGDEEEKRKAEALLRGADLAVVDAQYSRADYKRGYGHSAWEDWLEAASRAGIPRIVLSHHDPSRTDVDLDDLENTLGNIRAFVNVRARVAREGDRFTVGGGSRERRAGDRIARFLEELSAYRSDAALLDRILLQARRITAADAGTIFLAEGGDLVFAYTHNDTLFSVKDSHRHAYESTRIPENLDSIAGYVAATSKPLNIAEVRSLPPGVPYRFNDQYDRGTGFHTRSVLAIPFLGSRGRVLGVLQLINSLAEGGDDPVPFTEAMEEECVLLSRAVSSVLERSAAERNGIYGILRMAAVHDPYETGPHAERVGALSAEIYHIWALKKDLSTDLIRHEKDRIRLAAMLHDIGKVGVSDVILKKPGKLTEEEFAVMRRHTAIGASILQGDPGDVAVMARNIALHHHQKWNGEGYAGDGSGVLAGEDIPLEARITAVADVFDALVSPRCYKDPWTFEEALSHLRSEAGGHFDPELVECLGEIGGLIEAIYQRFPDEAPDTGGNKP
ncbi:MAG: HD domain-containing protein [Deltaproteobacteria bacterium]|jgi:HD-GYP domain-containing protein (c-di-GMP phosphodiesterase class II)/phosphoribosyl 1,2-cyclic phosphodiesterase|nr:HD domain-containing protein [Deltaproteobacteria bacterium]